MRKLLASVSLVCALAASGAFLSCAKDSVEGASLGDLPTTIAQEVVEGGPNPAPLAFVVANPGTCAMAFTLAASTTDGKPWLSVAPASGTVAAGDQQRVTVGFEVVTTALLPGTYTGSILATGTCTANGQPAQRSPRNISVNLTVVAAGAVLDLNRTQLGQDVVTLEDRWSRLSVEGAPEANFVFAAAFSGHELLLAVDNALPVKFGRYNVAGDAWSAVPGSPGISSSSSKAVWTGDRLLIWNRPNVLAYSPGQNVWSTLSATNAPDTSGGASVLWSGRELLVWGKVFNPIAVAGARFDPASGASGTWATMAAPPAELLPRAGHSVVWTGSEMIVWGGAGALVTEVYANGGRYNPTTNAWTMVRATNAPSARREASAVWTGSRMIVWGGMDAAHNGLADGKIYLPAQDEWRDMAPAPLAGRGYHTAVWTGSQMIVWGGEGVYTDAPYHGDGAAYDPATDTWTPLSEDNAPHARSRHGAVWTGTGMLIFGGLYEEEAAVTFPKSLHLYR